MNESREALQNRKAWEQVNGKCDRILARLDELEEEKTRKAVSAGALAGSLAGALTSVVVVYATAVLGVYR